MKLEQSFEVAAPLERVWEALIDVERVAPCLPGAAVTGRNDDGSYNGSFKVKIGPTSAAYTGKLEMENVDESAHTATMQAQGTDKRGQGGAKATIVSTISQAAGGATRVEVVTDYHITGRLARFGRGGMIEDISNRLLGEFAKCLQTSLAEAPAGDVVAVAEAPAGDAVAKPARRARAPRAGAGAKVGAAKPEAAAKPARPAKPRKPRKPAKPAAAAEPSADAPVEAQAPEAPVPPPPPVGPPPPPVGPPPPVAHPSPPVGPPVPESEPVQGLSLVASVLWGRAKRNPAPIAALVAGFLLALRVLRRRS